MSYSNGATLYTLNELLKCVEKNAEAILQLFSKKYAFLGII